MYSVFPFEAKAYKDFSYFEWGLTRTFLKHTWLKKATININCQTLSLSLINDTSLAFILFKEEVSESCDDLFASFLIEHNLKNQDILTFNKEVNDFFKYNYNRGRFSINYNRTDLLFLLGKK